MSNLDFTEFKPGNYNPQEVAQRGYGVVQYGPGDDGLIVGFYRRSILNKHRSEELGKPVHEDHDFVKIQHPGEALNIVDRPVQDSDKRRWPRQWMQYQEGVEQKIEGIPLSLLFPANPSIESTLRGYNIHTIEQLARLSGHGISTVGMGCQEWVNKAREYMVQAEKGVDFHRFNREIKDRDQKITTLERQVNDLTNTVNRLLDQRTQNQFAVPQHIDEQQTMIDNRSQENRPTAPAQTFGENYKVVDLSGEVTEFGNSVGIGMTETTMPKTNRGWPKGKPRGPRIPKENSDG